MGDGAAPPLLSVLIVAWNCRDHVRRCLEALGPAVAGAPAEIIIADNASTDGTAEMLRQNFPGIYLIDMGRNAGFAAAVNRAAGAARGEFLWLLNPDTIPTAQCVAALLECLRRQPRAGAAGPRLLDVGGATDPRSARRYPTIWSDWAEKAGLRRLALRLTRLPGAWDESRPAPCVSGAALCVRRAALGWGPDPMRPGAWPADGQDAHKGRCYRGTDVLDERFFLYAEDVDLCRRLDAAGWEVWYCGAATLTHWGGGSSAGAAEAAGIAAVVSLGRLFEKWEGRRRGDAYRVGIIILSALKLLLAAPAAPFWATARRKVGLHRRLIAALRAELRHD